MTGTQRIIVNTGAQYARTIINVCLSLYSTRIILAALGEKDFGIMYLVGGVVSMLAFMTNALVSTTQRYLSFYHGNGVPGKLHSVFGNSMLLHLLIGILLVVILSALEPYIIYHGLDIAVERTQAAGVVYFAALVGLFISVVTAPFRASFIARENIVYISVIDIIDGVLKLLMALWLMHVSWDRLSLYGILVAGISFFNLLAFAVYGLLKYEECHLPRLKEWSGDVIRELGGFAGWTVYSTGCVICRTQGLAWILNRMVGIIANTAYGITQQMAGAVAFLSQAIANAMSPQIIKAEGQGERQRMLMLSESASKYAFLLFSMAAVPLVAEMPAILLLWLKDVPEYTVDFCRIILIAGMCDQITMGLTIANQATGRIKYYSLVINTTKLLTLPVALVFLYMGAGAVSALWCYAGLELLCSVMRLPYLKVTAGMNITEYMKRVVARVAMPFVMTVAAAWLMGCMEETEYRFLLTGLVAIAVTVVTSWLFALEKDEKDRVRAFVAVRLGKNT